MSISVSLRLSGLLDAHFEVPGEGITAIIGPSGAGKTLLMRCIAGLERAEGTVVVEGNVWQDRGEEGRWLSAHERSVGYVFQGPSLLPHLTVERNLQFAARHASDRGLAVREAAELLGVVHLMSRMPERLSGGESQRVAIARALIRGPELFLLDEPVSGLDPAGRADVLRHVVRIREYLSAPMLYVTHDLDEVARIGDHLAILENGSVDAAGPLEEILLRLDLPLAHRPDAEAVLRGKVVGNDPENRIVSVQTGFGEMLVVGDPLPLDPSVRIRIKARDASLALDRPERTSILNILSGTVDQVKADDPADGNKVAVRLRPSASPLAPGADPLHSAGLLCHVSRRSAAKLDLSPGLEVYIQIKSVAILA